MNLALRVDSSDPTPPYDQLRRQLVTLIESGELTEGTRLPPVRQLAADLGLAAGTVARSYRELEHRGLVRTRRGGGTTVASVPRSQPPATRVRRARHLITEAVQQARVLGLTEEQITTILDEARASTSGLDPSPADEATRRWSSASIRRGPTSPDR